MTDEPKMIEPLQRFFDEEFPRLDSKMQKRVLDLVRLYVEVHEIEQTDPERGRQLAKMFGIGGAE